MLIKLPGNNKEKRKKLIITAILCIWNVLNENVVTYKCICDFNYLVSNKSTVNDNKIIVLS